MWKTTQMTKSILVIDDDKMLLDALSIGLRNAGFDVITAQSSEFATEILKKIRVDSIVLDRMLGGQDGLNFLKQLRASGNKVPVIMLTALSGPENAIDGLSCGANDYMAKPFQLQELVLRLKNIMKNAPVQNNDMEKSIGLIFTDNEFFVLNDFGQKKLLSLSSEEKKLLQHLTSPVGNTVSATPMVAKRLRNKINGVSSNIDIITVRGIGYKMIKTKQ